MKRATLHIVVNSICCAKIKNHGEDQYPVEEPEGPKGVLQRGKDDGQSLETDSMDSSRES